MTAAVAVIVVIILAALLIAWIDRPAQSLSNPCGGCGTAFALSPATEQGQPGNWWYNFSFQSAGGEMTLGDLRLQVQGPSGTNITLENATVTVLGPRAELVGVYSTYTAQWTMGGSELVTNQQILVIECSNDLRSQGDILEVLGGAGMAWTGSVSVSIP